MLGSGDNTISTCGGFWSVEDETKTVTGIYCAI
jgi:hypothetical protein